MQPMQSALTTPFRRNETENSETMKLIRLQRRIRKFLTKQRSVRIYQEMCSEDMSIED